MSRAEIRRAAPRGVADLHRSSRDMPPVLQHAAAGLAVGAVVDRVLLVVDARDRRAADVARLVELVVHAVGARVVRAALAQLEPALELGVDRVGEPLRPAPGRGPCDSANGDSRAWCRISFAQARPIPAITRWSRSSEWSRRDSCAQIAASASAPSPSASGPEVRELRLGRLRA